MPADPFSNTDVITPEMEAAADAMGFNTLADVGKDIEEGTEPKTGFETPGFVGGSVIGGGTAYDPGPGVGDTGTDTSGDLMVDVTFELDVEENPCGDVEADIASTDVELETGYPEFTNAHIIVCTNQSLTDLLNEGDLSALTSFKKINSPGDYTESIISMSNFGSLSKSPIDGKDKKVHSLSVSLPENSKYICVHSFTCIDLMEANKKYGTDFSDRYKVLDHSSEVLMMGGETISKASIGSNTISNIKIKDYNKLSKLSSIDISIVPTSSEIISNPIKEFAASKNGDETVSFVFDLDVAAALKSSSLGSIFFNGISMEAKNEIISEATIISLDVVRKRIDVPYDSEQSSEEVIASSFQKTKGSLLLPNTKKINDREEVDSVSTGYIAEMNMQGADDIRTFSGSDFLVPQSGKYEYTVKLVLRDAIAIYLRKKMHKFGVKIRMAEQWLQEMSNPKYSDELRGTFSYLASRDVRRGYGTQNTPMQKALSFYSEIAGDVFGIIDSKSVIDIAFPMINSTTGSPSGAQAVVDAMKSLQNKMFNMLGGTIQSGQTTSEIGPFSGFGSPTKGFLEFERTFDKDLLDMTGPVSTGYSYLRAPAENKGVAIVSAEEYNSRVALELDSLSTGMAIISETALPDTILSDSKVSAISNLSTTVSTYLTPSSVKIGGDMIRISDTNTKGSTFTSDSASGIIEGLRAHKKNINKDSSSSIGLLSGLGITCELIGKQKTKGGTFAVDSLDHGSIFSESDNFTSKNIEIDELKIEKLEEILTDQIAASLSPIINNGSQDSSQGQMDLNLFDVSSSESVAENMNVSELSGLPNQIKSVFLSNSENIKQNFLSDPSEALFDIKCNSVAQIEVLTYKVDENGNMESNWVLLTPFRINQAKNKSLRCRIKNYSNSSLGVGQKTDLEAPIFNDQFVLGGKNISSPRKMKKNLVSQKMERYLTKQNTAIRNELKSISGVNTKRN